MNRVLLEDRPGGVKVLFQFKFLGVLSLTVTLLLFFSVTEEEPRSSIRFFISFPKLSMLPLSLEKPVAMRNVLI